jgi:hypothetical protein
MSSKNLAACTLIAAGLLAASVPALANARSNDSRNTPSAATQPDRREAPSDRIASLTEVVQNEVTYGAKESTPSMKNRDSRKQPATILVSKTRNHDHGQN